MRKFVFNIGILGLFALLFSSVTPIVAAVDTTTIGENDNDEFVFVVDKYTSLFGDVYSPGFWGDADVKAGGQFTMKILNSTPSKYYYSENYYMEVEFDNGTHQSEYDLDLPVGVSETDPSMEFVIFTDWDFWEQSIDEALTISKEAGDIGSYSIDNGETDFTVKTSLSVKDGGASSKSVTETIYEKSTGVLLYEYSQDTLSSPLFSWNFESKIRRDGFTPPSSGSDGGFLPGFELFFAFSAIVIVVFFLKKKN